MPANNHLGPQFGMMLPAGSTLHHASYQADRIRAEGIRPSRQGESGPGIYTTPDPDYAARMVAGGRTGMTFETTTDLHLLDRTTPEGEQHYRSLHAGYSEEGSAKTVENLRDAGYHGVFYPTRTAGKPAPEVVVHDPAHLRLRD